MWKLVAAQHGVVSRAQLLALGLTGREIDGRVASGRLHVIHRGVYAVGRPELGREGRLMAAVLAGGAGAVLSDAGAAAHWGVIGADALRLEITVPPRRAPRVPGIRVHRRAVAEADRSVERGIPITGIVRTLLDLAVGGISAAELERAINEADRLDLIDPEGLRTALSMRGGERGVARLRAVLDRRTFTLTDSELERLFLPVVRAAGLPPPLTRQRVNGFRVDFYWPELGLVVETDGLRYHRTAAAQARDRLRDQTHLAAGLTPLRFTHAQVRYERGYVRATLARVARRLRAAA